MTSPPTDPTAWLASAPRLALVARIQRRPPPGFWKRLFGASDEGEPPLGALELDAEGVRSSLEVRASVCWAEPFVLQPSAWLETGELSVTLRQRGRAELGFRTLASPSWLAALEAPAQQSLHPFVLPEHVAPLWNALRFFAQVHALRLELPPWPEPDADLLERDSAPPAQLCTSCGGYLLVSIGAQAYRCTQCGYEGGEGYAAMLQAERRAELEALTGDARRERLAVLLEDTRAALIGIHDTYMHPLSGNEHEVKTARTYMLQAATLEAVLLLRDARILAPPALAAELDALDQELTPFTKGRERPGRTRIDDALQRLERART